MNAQAHLYRFWMELIYKHECQNLAMMLQLTLKRPFGEHPNGEEASGQIETDMDSGCKV